MLARRNSPKTPSRAGLAAIACCLVGLPLAFSRCSEDAGPDQRTLTGAAIAFGQGTARSEVVVNAARRAGHHGVCAR